MIFVKLFLKFHLSGNALFYILSLRLESAKLTLTGSNWDLCCWENLTSLEHFTQQTAVRTQWSFLWKHKVSNFDFWFLRFSLDLFTFFKRMASNAKHAKYDSAADDLIFCVKRSYFMKTVDEEFLNHLKSMIEGKITLYTSGI